MDNKLIVLNDSEIGYYKLKYMIYSVYNKAFVIYILSIMTLLILFNLDKVNSVGYYINNTIFNGKDKLYF